MVLSPKGEDKYEMKYVPEDFDRYDQGFFGRAKPEYIIVKGCLLYTSPSPRDTR
mgnify:FL=1